MVVAECGLEEQLMLEEGRQRTETQHTKEDRPKKGNGPIRTMCRSGHIVTTKSSRTCFHFVFNPLRVVL